MQLVLDVGQPGCAVGEVEVVDVHVGDPIAVAVEAGPQVLTGLVGVHDGLDPVG